VVRLRGSRGLRVMANGSSEWQLRRAFSNLSDRTLGRGSGPRPRRPWSVHPAASGVETGWD